MSVNHIIRTILLMACLSGLMALALGASATSAAASTTTPDPCAIGQCSELDCEEIGYDHPDCGEPPCEYTQTCPPEEPEEPTEPEEVVESEVDEPEVCTENCGLDPEITDDPVIIAPAVAGEDAEPVIGGGRELPFTGLGLWAPAAFGLALMLTGAGSYRLARRRNR